LQEDPKQCTRFLSLASVANAEKKKWLYAFTVTPGSNMPVAKLVEQPNDVTECPYSADKLPSLQSVSYLVMIRKSCKKMDSNNVFNFFCSKFYITNS